MAVSIYVTPVLRFYKCGIYNQYQDPTSCLQMNIPVIEEENKPGVDINPSQVNHGVAVVGYEVIDNSQDTSQSDTTVQYDPSEVDPQTGFKVSENGDNDPQYILDGKKNEEIINQLEKIINLNLPHYLSDNDSFKLDDDTDSEFKTNLKKQLDYYTKFKEKIQTNEIENGVYTIRNSWSDSWGENGYLRMQAGINNLQVIDQVFTCSGVSSTPPKDYESTCNFSNADQNENEHCAT